MSFFLSNLLTSNISLPNAAGGVVAAPEAGKEGEFAEALAAFRAEATGGEAAVAAVAGANTQISGPVAVDANTVIALKDKLPELIEKGAVYKIGADGQPVPLTEEEANALLASCGLPPMAPKTSAGNGEQAEADVTTGVPGTKDEIKTNAVDAAFAAAGLNLVVAAPVAAASGGTVAAADLTGNEEMALKLADAAKKPPAPPVPELPGAPEDPETTKPGQTAAPLLEGRAATAGPPPVITDVPEAPQLSAAQLEAVAPRAVTSPATAAPEPDATAPATAASAPPVVVAAPAAAAPVPEIAKDIAATPHVTSVQGKTIADAPANDDAPAPAATAASSTAAPASDAVPAKQTEIPAPATNLAADVNTQAEAADPALAVLTKDKAEAKAAAAQTPAAAASAAPEQADAVAPKPETTADADVKPAEAKPETAASEKKPASEKPAVEPRAPQAQPQVPITDKAILADGTIKTHQQPQGLMAAAVPQIAGEMAAHIKRGATRFEIRLDPPELGRVDVRVEIDSDGRVHSRLMVEKSETLDLLKADQRALERALNEAGFKSEQNSLSFSLKDERGGGFAKFQDQEFQRERMSDARVNTESEDEPARIAAGIAYRASLRGPGGFDLRV